MARAEQSIREINANSNLVGVLVEMFKGQARVAGQVVCDGKVKASLLMDLPAPISKQHVIEIAEDGLVNF